MIEIYKQLNLGQEALNKKEILKQEGKTEAEINQLAFDLAGLTPTVKVEKQEVKK